MVGVGRLAGLDAMLLEIGCGQKDPQRGEAGNPQFHIFRCTIISWIHVEESVSQSLNHSFFLKIFGIYLGHVFCNFGNIFGISGA